jgi:serine/threonine-protein kinase HipA|tara:strand:+ start:2341 stop:2895 length:555 start_codon:yes stop_codon:yes gene_type:complete
MNGAFVGTWRVRPHVGEILQYDDNWTNSSQGRPLSLSLPFTPGNQPHRGDAVRAYFENLLPDSKDIRERVARRFQTNSTEAFALLAEIGRDCAGALQVLPNSAPPESVQEVKATPLNDAEVAQILRNTLAPASSVDRDSDDVDFRISIAGAQEKTALSWLNNQWCLPHCQCRLKSDPFSSEASE